MRGIVALCALVVALVAALPLSTFEGRNNWPARGFAAHETDEHALEAPSDQELEPQGPVSHYEMPAIHAEKKDAPIEAQALPAISAEATTLIGDVHAAVVEGNVTLAAETAQQIEEDLEGKQNPSPSPVPSASPKLIVGHSTNKTARVAQCEGTCGEGMSMFTVWTTPIDGWMDKYTRSIDSALYFHPKARLTIYSSSLSPDFLDDFKALGYDVHVERLEVKERAKNTPLEKWAERMDKWHTGPYYYAHLSDAMRLLVLYLEGGVYFDTDIIFVNPVDEIRNSIGWERSDSICNAFMSFEKNNSFVEDSLNGLTESYGEVVNDWAGAGPALMTGIYQQNYSRMDHPDVVHALDRSAFYPISWDEISKYFEAEDEADKARDMALLRRQSFTVHFWNSRTHDMQAHPTSLIQHLFDSFCVYCGHIVNPSQDDQLPKAPVPSPLPLTLPTLNTTVTTSTTTNSTFTSSTDNTPSPTSPSPLPSPTPIPENAREGGMALVQHGLEKAVKHIPAELQDLKAKMEAALSRQPSA